ncbi:INO80 complex subunit B [Coemansia sp. RSA 989]|nr:INO80 complex subunit B [Coemansia sp. RSA 1086]KAJ1863853.1 INO80 complex subunit B [Coemansia sp. RSA 989]KAJ1874342.1 INO80 complex subunit B [Coemansia sp. RSA 990]KAJ2630976.1 INO80 complex subunit B [Coemansia sp. RSA 1290]KAJ2649466.1 INO80 complex subunit B [Coemansia sp. RSA 1250]KAJ2670769.1 INO80 complex subunit B [Coemansia sp. RSA 1085]
MPPKRKINDDDDDSTTPSDTASDASEPDTRRTRRPATSDPQSPAPSTRRSARLTRGLRRDSDAGSRPARGRGAPRGGRGRGRPKGSGAGRGGAKRGAPAGRRGRGRPRANASSKSDSGSEPDDESDAAGLLDKSDSDELEEPSHSSESSPPRSASTDLADPAEDGAMSGLSDVGELVTGPSSSLTRRQRAKLNREQGADLVELPLDAKRSRFSAEESALRKSEHARRRKFQSQQRAEQLKNDTINRLLNKQSSKGRNRVADDPDSRANSAEASPGPSLLRYSQRCVLSGHAEPVAHPRCALSLPADVQIADLFPAGGPVPYPDPAPPCAVAGCQLKKKYSAGARPACSLAHWKALKANAS